MRTIINNLKQAEQNNYQLCQQLASQEQSHAQAFSNAGQANFQSMANAEAGAANLLNQFANAEKNAVQQLNQLDQYVVELQNRLS